MYYNNNNNNNNNNYATVFCFKSGFTLILHISYINSSHLTKLNVALKDPGNNGQA